MSEPTDLRKVRGTAKGQVTCLKQSILRMKGKSLTDYDSVVLDRYIIQASRASQNFLESHTVLSHVDPSLDEAQVHEEEEEHQEVMDAVRKSASYIQTCIKARTIGNRLNDNMQDLKENLVGGYTAGMASKYTNIEAEFQDFRNQVAKGWHS